MPTWTRGFGAWRTDVPAEPCPICKRDDNGCHVKDNGYVACFSLTAPVPGGWQLSYEESYGAARVFAPFKPDDEPPDEETTQQLTRRRTADGGELLTGWVRVSMAAGQRSTNVHLAFCPSFGRAPRVAVKQLGGPEARIKTVQVLPYAARFDLKLAALSESASTLLLQFSAEAAPSALSSGEIEGASTAEGRDLA